MKKYFLLLIAFLIISPSAFSLSAGVVCFSNDQTNIAVKGSLFGETPSRYPPKEIESFLIILSNLSGNDIEVISVQAKGVLTIEESPRGTIKQNEDFRISGHFPSYRMRDEEISFNYKDHQGNEKELLIVCSGRLPRVSMLDPFIVLFLSFILLLVLPLVGVILTFCGYKKKKNRAQVMGLFLVIVPPVIYFTLLPYII